MFYVYILKSQKYNWKYIGYCVDLRKRFLEHNSGKVKSTKARKPYNLLYYEAYDNKTSALKREIELKHNSSKKEELLKRVFEN
ncbi:MAG: Endo/excinuclease amino domain protein [Candidatus Roizmanbacteria bacterium GW2011_GWC2_41_7]|uniref:Endo/excinuclease amino domain protein n=1 Tax=Candidatus Roizmanbacteria bacterium GW2011_GWC2_41_7 TaxID=1618487 RepID=A0A0G0X5K3_9BACT|nr:MAG: Endo/excinuclease amino domain protein [Candidatus Roizmanbacteria bacterium GW2011_GWC2_41_7]